MRKLMVLAVALAACGGSEGETDPGTGSNSDELCQTYTPSPHSDPSLSVTSCVPEDWPRDSFCWHTADAEECEGDDRLVPVGCIYIRDSDTGATEGLLTFGCAVGPGECLSNAIDNPECCGGAYHPDRLAAWACD